MDALSAREGAGVCLGPALIGLLSALLSLRAALGAIVVLEPTGFASFPAQSDLRHGGSACRYGASRRMQVR